MSNTTTKIIIDQLKKQNKPLEPQVPPAPKPEPITEEDVLKTINNCFKSFGEQQQQQQQQGELKDVGEL